MISETHFRSVTKSIGWRVLGILFLVFVTYLFTRNWITTTLITVCHHGVFILVYYLHERFWLWSSWLQVSRFKPFMRIILYEIILGNLILATTTYAFTGNLQTVTAITLTYIGNKLWMFYAYDYIWSKVQWQTR